MYKEGIYKIINPKGKIYIGQSIKIERRWGQYKNFKSNITSIGPKLLNSLKKYGFESHKLEIIEECSLEQLDERETYWKKHYNSIDEGLNCELYDRGGGPRTLDTKRKMSNSQKLNLSKPEVIEKRKINCKIAANKPGVQEKAVKNTNWEQRENNRLKSMDYTKLKKPIIQFDLLNNLLKEWGGFIDIKNNLSFDSGPIRKCCKGLQKTAYGYKWKYK